MHPPWRQAGEGDCGKAKETAGRGRLVLAGGLLPAPELCLCLNPSSLQGAHGFVLTSTDTGWKPCVSTRAAEELRQVISVNEPCAEQLLAALS